MDHRYPYLIVHSRVTGGVACAWNLARCECSLRFALSALSSFGARRGYGARSNLPDNFDPNIGAKSCKKSVLQPDKAHPSKPTLNPSISESNTPSLTSTEQDAPSLPLSTDISASPTPPEHPTNPLAELTNISTFSRMPVGSFPPLTSV